MVRVRLFSNTSLMGYVLAIIAVIVVLYPSNEELGTYLSTGKQADQGRELLENALKLRPEHPRLLLKYAKLAEAQGDIPTAIEATAALTRQRPMNRAFRMQLAELQRESGRHQESLRTIEAALQEKVVPLTREMILHLISEWEWLNEYESAKKWALELRTLKNLERTDIDVILSYLASSNDDAGIAQTVIDAFKYKLYRKQDVFDIARVQLNENRVDAALHIYSEMKLNDGWTAADGFELSEILRSIKKYDAALNELCDTCSRFKFSDEQWNQLARLLIEWGKITEARRILENLLEGKSPQCPCTREAKHCSPESPWGALKTVLWTAGDSLWGVSTAHAGTLNSRQETLELLKTAQEAQSDDAASVHSTELLIEELKLKKGRKVKERRRRLLSELAKKKVWAHDPEGALDVLKQPEVGALSCNDTLVEIIALEDASRTEEAQMKALLWQCTDSAQEVEASLLQRKDEIKALALRSSAQSWTGASLDAAVRERRPSALTASWDFIRTDTLFVPAAELDLRWHGRSQHGGLLSTLRHQRVNPVQTKLTEANAGGGYWGDRIDATMQVGRRWQSPYYPWMGRAQIAFSSDVVDFVSLSTELSRPRPYSVDMNAKAVTSTVFTLYIEKRLSPWVMMWSDLTAELTHAGRSMNKGRGIETSGRLAFGKKSFFIKGGPWARFLRWSATDATLDGIILPRATATGAFLVIASVDESKPLFAQLTAGWGLDFAREPVNTEASFVEALARWRISRHWALSADYSLYSDQFTQALSTLTHLSKLSLTRSF